MGLCVVFGKDHRTGRCIQHPWVRRCFPDLRGQLRISGGGAKLTCQSQSNPREDAQLQRKYVEHKVSVVVVRYAIIDPWTVTGPVSKSSA
jgi:hypothetical protein